jgi:Rrf2 family transcriptional regulator, iron-sulfur cluster assembly transcription factor
LIRNSAQQDAQRASACNEVMKLTTKGRFAVTAMIDVALFNHGEPVTLAEISGRQKISLSYLEQLFGKLRRHGLVDSVRGPGGGYNLAKAAGTISVSDIILAVDEPIDTTSCGGEKNCRDDSICLTHHLWASLNAHIFTYLQGVSLQSLVDDAKARKNPSLHVVQDLRKTLARPIPIAA